MIVLPLGRPEADLPNTPGRDGSGWDCALVNIMPDSAFEATERQFAELLGAGSGRRPLRVRLFTLPGVPRSDAISEQIATRYSPMEDLERHVPDVLVVSGANPIESRIQDEPFWDDLARLLSWASDHVSTMLLSCLSAHAALTVFDGIERLPLATKCTGVFAQTSDPASPLATDLGPDDPASPLSMERRPHERHAGGRLRPADLLGGGRLERRHPAGEPGLGGTHAGPSRVRRHQPAPRVRARRPPLRGGRAGRHPRSPPTVRGRTRLERPGAIAATDPRRGTRPGTHRSFPFRAIGSRARRTWRKTATRIYANWLASVPSKGH